jgi:hypothetical protein
MTEAYQALCELWASPEYQEKLGKKRKSGAAAGKHSFGIDGYVHFDQQMVNPHIIFFTNIYTIICY